MTNNLFDLTFSANSGREFLSGRFDINTNNFQFNMYALKSDLGNAGPYRMVEVGVKDLNNPPNAFILQTNPDAGIPGFPTGIGGNTVLIIQLFP